MPGKNAFLVGIIKGHQLVDTIRNLPVVIPILKVLSHVWIYHADKICLLSVTILMGCSCSSSYFAYFWWFMKVCNQCKQTSVVPVSWLVLITCYRRSAWKMLPGGICFMCTMEYSDSVGVHRETSFISSLQCLLFCSVL